LVDTDRAKQLAAHAALEFVVDIEVVGVGTGSTVNHFIEALAGQGRVRTAVSSSQSSTERLRRHGIEVVDLNEAGTVEVYVDGADEADPGLRLIKGGGGALTREKILAQAARRFVCIVDESKLVDALGTFPLPVEVIPMARAMVARELTSLGGRPVLRRDFLTDNGNEILDVHDLTIRDPVTVESDLNQIPGVVTVGLFARRPADVLLIGADDGVRQIDHSSASDRN
jgi:ribose 5-phosphate isomerase A